MPPESAPRRRRGRPASPSVAGTTQAIVTAEDMAVSRQAADWTVSPSVEPAPASVRIGAVEQALDSLATAVEQVVGGVELLEDRLRDVLDPHVPTVDEFVDQDPPSVPLAARIIVLARQVERVRERVAGLRDSVSL